MERYKIIIADDEREIREGIIKRIDWGSYGFIIAGSAENGKEALELTEKLNPDVVMADIMMPFLNGLELAKVLSKKMPSVKVIIFSGSDDLEYAHQAIKLNVIEYVLKPVNAKEMGLVLGQLKIKLDQEYAKKRDFETLRKHYVESIPIIREQFLVGLAEGRVTPMQFERQAELAGVDKDAFGFLTGLFWIEKEQKSEFAQHFFQDHDDSLVQITIYKMIEEELKAYCNFTGFLYGDMIAVIINLHVNSQINDIIQGMDEICRKSEKIYGLTVSGGLSLPCHNPWEIRYARKQAQTALDYRLAFGRGKTIFIGDVEPDLSAKLQFHGEDERSVLTAVRMGREEDIISSIQKIFDTFEQVILPMNRYQVYYMEIIVSLLQLLQNYKLDYNIVFGLEFNPYHQMKEFNDFAKAKQWIIEKCIMISKIIRRERVDTSLLLADKARRYVQEHYEDCELCVETLSEELHVSPTYFSTLFKKETGSSFITYLTDIRLSAAVNLLNTTDDKSYAIARKVGYNEANYFSYVFKKKFGVSPSKYRNNGKG